MVRAIAELYGMSVGEHLIHAYIIHGRSLLAEDHHVFEIADTDGSFSRRDALGCVEHALYDDRFRCAETAQIIVRTFFIHEFVQARWPHGRHGASGGVGEGELSFEFWL